ncbi:glycosyltransferase [Microcoleus sp. FACHB-672]|uniref:glycosyltransferase n=1 Tax=Microcoleus sp. FACHB-672 TaxID=2692825 RepID=UPI001682DA51|nr:glycosyltransferase [Microcoleus sp. FACHB-672]MBD2043784.1 glycosyltransferase [Microcoleus sp. FACHB-672]
MKMSPSQANNFSNPAFLPKVSVIAPIYNGEADLPDLLNCLRSQTYPADLVEYLLVDNNSSDQTGTLIAAAGEGFRHLNENQIQSSYAARNTGIRAAIGEILAFTDADCRPNPNWLYLLIQPFVNQNVGIVAGEIEALAGKTLLEKYASRHDTLSQKHTLAHPFCPYGQTANLAIRRQVLEEVALFRPYLTTGGDADICWRILRQTHWQLEFVPEAIVEHRHRSTLRQLQSQWRRYGESNKYLHELHGIDLMRELTAKESLYRISRWLLKELPAASVKAITGKAGLADLLSTPLDLFCFQARTTGQREANLVDKSRQIEPFIQSSN